MGRLFGTDGIRGKANDGLTPEYALKIGKSGAYVLTKTTSDSPTILVGNDSRISCDMLEAALTAGICSVGANVVSVGSIPTPAIAYLIKKYNADAGVMISASHNVYSDNGIKYFSSEGFKLSDEIEDEIEKYITGENGEIPLAEGGFIGRRHLNEDALADYVEFIKSKANGKTLEGLTIALDCSNGATSFAAPLVFHELGATVLVMSNEPNGVNINDGCGSTHIEGLCGFVRENRADIGFAYDGDGDRLIAVDENGEKVDGDQIMTILANSMKKEGNLKNNTVVATVMSNLGFMQSCKRNGIDVEVTKVGDRYVLDNMIKNGHSIGGEQSGHIILLDHTTTGDGIMASVFLALDLKKSGRKFSELNRYMKVLPQALINAKASNEVKEKYLTDEKIQKEISEIEKKYSETGRLLIRPSGTEPVIRVMIEGENLSEITRDAERLAEMIEKLGGL